MSDHVLTIDLGTSGPKTAVFTLDGGYVDGEFEPVELLLGDHGAAEQRPSDWWAAIVAGMRRLRERGALPADGFAAVSVTSQWSGTVAIDADGEPVCDAVIWMDSRGAEQIGRIVGGPLKVQGYDPRKLRKWIQLTGGVPSLSGKDPVAHIHWLRQHRPELDAVTRMYLEPKDWLNLKLTGVRAATYDSIVMTWVTDNRDPSHVRYDDELLQLAGLRREWMPDLVPATSVIGGADRRRGERARRGSRDAGHRGHTRRAVRGGRIRRGARLRGPPVPGDLVVAVVPHPDQEDRRAPRRCVAAESVARPLLRRRRAGDCRRVPELAARQRRVQR